MKDEEVVSLLEQNWGRLRDELGDKWPEFAGSYRGIVGKLPAQPTQENLTRAVNGVWDLLRRYEFGRGLLRGYQGCASDQQRLGDDGSKTTGDQESVQQVCNRLTELSKQEPQEGRGQEDDARDAAKDGSQV
jgi:hypothetical protein